MHEIHILYLGEGDAPGSFLVKGMNTGPRRVPSLAFLVLGNPLGPILVDTGFRSPEIMGRVGADAIVAEGQGLEAQLALHGLELGDVAMIVHTHAHIDHAGRDDAFPMSTPVVLNRRELEVAAVGGVIYPAEDVKHLIDRLHTPGALKLLDLAESGPVHIAPGIRCELAGGHTDGSINVLIETSDGVATLCGDLVYRVQEQIVKPWAETLLDEPAVSGNSAAGLVQEKAAIKRALESGDWLLSSHDQPAKVEYGRVVGRVRGAVVPGPVTPPEGAPPPMVQAV
jgi:glyoxylase-like metal-dependent hydrolase (beta-lactamase superfamily II)